MHVQSRTGRKYIATFIDDCTDTIWAYNLASKDQLITVFKEFKALVETQFQSKIKIFRSDHSGEYQSNEFIKLLKNNDRSDALIISPSHDLVCIKLDDELYEWAIQMSEDLASVREELETMPKKYDKVLRRTLQDLWELIVGPVVDALKEMHVEPSSRIWWCPTSVVFSLPLHAVGPAPLAEGQPAKSNKSRKLYLHDLYISSYTPTLTALIEARLTILPRVDEHPGLLGVALIDKSLEAAGDEMNVLKAHFSVHDQLSLAIGGDCTREIVLAGLKQRPWVHFTCHGVLEPDEPFNSAFILSGNERLTLLDIIKTGLHNAELAVLSVCHTAEQTHNSASEEALHLAAAMQFSGFRSVVGTMWQMKDEDGPVFVEHFYREVLTTDSNETEQPGRLPEARFQRSARALCLATKIMRERKVNLERWVNFVHIGA